MAKFVMMPPNVIFCDTTPNRPWGYFMSVYTRVDEDEMSRLLENYDIGRLQSLQGIAQGITNSNYFLDTDKGSYVLTVFEALTQKELPFFLKLKKHLSMHGVACPIPLAQRNGNLDAYLMGKPACIVSRLDGHDTSYPTIEQCFYTGVMLAKMHVAGTSFGEHMNNPRHAAWWKESADKLLSFLDKEDMTLLIEEIDFLAKHTDTHLPHGIIHADLFKDNVLLNGNRVAGFIDFYYACYGSFVYDIAIAVNDWARTAENVLDKDLQDAFMRGYETVRPLSVMERDYLPIAHRTGCLRFWVSRLLDFHFPIEGELTFIKDPNVFRDLLMTFH